MAIYKPTNCTPFLTTFDCRIEATDAPVFFECRIDSSNRNAVGYSVTVYDENNDQVFPPDGSAPDEHISQVSDLKRLTGAGNAATETSFMIQSSGYSNLNTGLNGSYLKFPFFLNSSYWQNSTGDTDQSAFKSVNTVYYDSATEKLYWYNSTDSNAKEEVLMYNGNTYKWVITLYQGDEQGNTPPTSGLNAYKYYDMQLTTGEVMGSHDERIQTKYSDKVYIDYYIQPVKISNLSYNPSKPEGWTGGSITEVGTRARIKNIDSTYGYIYPQMDETAYQSGTITKGTSNGYRIYQMGNDPENLSVTRKVDMYVGTKRVPFDWNALISNTSTSYGSIVFYVLVSGQTVPSGLGLSSYRVNSVDGMTADVFDPFSLKSLSSIIGVEGTNKETGEKETQYDEDSASVRWFYTGSYAQMGEGTRVLLNAQYPLTSYTPGNESTTGDTSRTYNISAGQTTDYTDTALISSPFNGIYTTRFGDNGIVSIKIGNNAPLNFHQYTVSWDRVTDADSWGELMNKVVAVTGGVEGVGTNKQTSWGDEDSPPDGTLNITGISFGSERPLTIYEDGTDSNHKTTGLIFYTDEEEIITNNSIMYISPFVGIKRGMYWIEKGNQSDTNRRRFVISFVDENYWFVKFNTSGYKFPSSFTTVPERETPYVIKSYFRDSDENPFDLYENPTIDLKVYRDENHTYDANATAPQGKYEDVAPDPSNPLYYMDPNTKDGSYCLEENYGQTSIVLLRVDRRSVWVEAEYNQSDFISWRSAQWFLYDGVSTNGTLLQSTDTYFDGKLGHQFYGLEENHVYTIVLVLETNSGLTLSKDIQIITDFNIADVTNFPFALEYQCETHSVYMRFGLSGFILPNLRGTATGDRVQDLNNEEAGTDDPIPGVTYSDYDNGQGWMNIDGTNANFPDEGVTYQYIVSVLNGEEAAATQMSSKEDDGTFTFESRHIVDATNSWGNIVGFQYISDEEANDAFSSSNQAQIFLPNYNTTYTYDNVDYDYIDDKLLYQMRYQVGNFEGVPTIVDKDTGATISSKGIWGIETSGGNKTTTAPLIVSGWLRDWHESDQAYPTIIGDAVRPEGYEIVVINSRDGNEHYSPIEDNASGPHYKESLFDFLGEGVSNGTASEPPIIAWSRREEIYDNFTVPPKNDPTSENGGEAGHLYQGPEDGTFHNFQVRTSVGANSWTNYQIIGPNPSLWSDNNLENKDIITGGQRVLTWNSNGEVTNISFQNTAGHGREIENLDSHWVWDDGSGEHDVDNTAYDVSSANAKFWVDGDDNGELMLFHQKQYPSSARENWATIDLRTGMDKYDFTFHMAVKNAFVGATEDDIQVQVFRGNAQDNTD